jgi:tetratricopeptide (TPR) repeat protein/DNA-binding CsgD family transcriptional regulator
MMLHSCSGHNNKGHNGTSVRSQYSKDTTTINTILNRIILNDVGNYDNALKQIAIAEILAEKNNYNTGLANVLFRKGSILYQQNKNDKALDCYARVIKLCEKSENILLKAQCLERMASIHLGADDPNLALKQYYEALTLFEKVMDKKGIAKIYNVIGFYYIDKGNYDIAEMYLNKSLKINSENRDTGNIIENKGNMAFLYEQSGQTKKAENIYYELIGELVKRDNKQELPYIYYNLASLYQKRKELMKTLLFLKKAMQIAESTKDSSLLSTLYGNTGEIYLINKKRDSASIYLLRSVMFAKALGDAETAMQALSFLITIDSMNSNYKEAYLKSKEVLMLMDTVTHQKIRNNIQSTLLQYENEKKTNQINIQHTALRAEKKQNQIYLVLLGLFVVTASLLTIILNLQKRNNRRIRDLYNERLMVKDLELAKKQQEDEINRLKIEKFQEEIYFKEKEQLSNALAIEQRNELLNLISEKIKSSTGEPDSFPVSVLNEIVSSIKMQRNDSPEMELFNRHFASLHKDFYTNISNVHPNLTKAELKFCAYLRIDLSSNQIANYLNVTNEAIRKTRYRLRKKLNLSQNESLENYIQRF